MSKDSNSKNDGNNNSNYHDLMRATYLLAAMSKDSRRDATLFPAEAAYSAARLGVHRRRCVAESRFRDTMSQH